MYVLIQKIVTANLIKSSHNDDVSKLLNLGTLKRSGANKFGNSIPIGTYNLISKKYL